MGDKPTDVLDLDCEVTCEFCPVQIEGTINGTPFYFRSRFTGWSIAVGDNPVSISEAGDGKFYRYEDWGDDGEYDAGYMPIATAMQIVFEQARAYVDSTK